MNYKVTYKSAQPPDEVKNGKLLSFDRKAGVAKFDVTGAFPQLVLEDVEDVEEETKEVVT